MPKRLSVSLDAPLSGLVETLVKTGRYPSASETLRAGLRLLEAREVEGDGSTGFDLERFIAGKREG